MSQCSSEKPSCIAAKANSPKGGQLADLYTLPTELVLKVIEHLDAAKHLASLSKTCRRFRDLSAKEGWRIFVQTGFPSLLSELSHNVSHSDIDWRERDKCGCQHPNHSWDAIHGSRSHRSDRRGAIVNGIDLRQSDRQSTPYHPVIASKLDSYGKPSSKKETVVWSTGTDVFIRVRRSGSMLPKSSGNPSALLDLYGNEVNMFCLQNSDFRSGFDDVTSINLVQPSTQPNSSSSDELTIDVIVGRASGILQKYSVSDARSLRQAVTTYQAFDRQGSAVCRTVRSADVNGISAGQLLAACSDKVLLLYKTDTETRNVQPISEVGVAFDNLIGQAWTTKFSSDDTILVGLGPSWKPIRSYRVTPTGLNLTAALSLGLEPRGIREKDSDSLASVYAIEPLSVGSRTGGSSKGQLFLSGWYDGICRYVVLIIA
jgi:hypothetical protein